MVPHELNPVKEEEDQLALAAQEELELEHEDEGEPDGEEEEEEEEEEEDRRWRREELGHVSNNMIVMAKGSPSNAYY